MIRSQSPKGKQTTSNISPPKVTISTCPTRMIAKVKTKPLAIFFVYKPFNADASVIKALALKMFQNCIKTKIVKSNDNSLGVKWPPIEWKQK